MSHPGLNQALREADRAARAQRERTSSHRASQAGDGLPALQGESVVCTGCGDHLPVGAMLRSENGPVCLECDGLAQASLELSGAWKTEVVSLMTRLVLSTLVALPGPALLAMALFGQDVAFKGIGFAAVMGLWGVVGHPMVVLDTARRAWKVRARLHGEEQSWFGGPALSAVAALAVVSATLPWLYLASVLAPH